MNDIHLPNTCEPEFYNTNFDLLKCKIGSVVSVTFQDKSRVAKKYKGQTLKFIVKKSLKHNWRRPTQRLALVPLDKVENWKDEDVLIIDDYDRFVCLMIDLFAINRRPYAGWKNKEVKMKILK